MLRLEFLFGAHGNDVMGGLAQSLRSLPVRERDRIFLSRSARYPQSTLDGDGKPSFNEAAARRFRPSKAARRLVLGMTNLAVPSIMSSI